VARGEFATRLPSGATNEIGEVTAAFNEMASSLESYETKNEAQLAELEAINVDLSQAREDLIFAEKMATVGRLAAGVAHEVGNPLASVIGFVDLLQREPDGEMARDLLPRIKAELDRINGIIRDLLNFSRPTGTTDYDIPTLEVSPPVSLPHIVDAVLQLVRLQPRFGQVEVAVDLPAGFPNVQVPADRLQQVILNLFVNSAEAMGGQGMIHVRQVDSAAEGCVTVEIEDDGPGIDPRAGSNIYEPFFTTKDIGDGTGLGLAVSLRLVEKMGGSLRHLRDRDHGATFHLSLPRAEPSL
jgi:signal transduction histidine kinase